MLSFSQPFSQSMTPTVRAHLDAQYSLFRDMSQKVFETAQKVNELNIQAARAVFEENVNSMQQIVGAKDPYEAISIAAGQARPTAERVRAYQQHLTNIAAGTQADLAKTAESHVPNTSRTAAAVADEVARKTREQADKAAGAVTQATSPRQTDTKAQGTRANA